MLKEGLDQFLHFAVAFAVTSLAVDGMLPGAYTGLVIGLVREHAQMQDSFDRTIGLNRLLDLTFWSLGGLVGGLL